MIAGGRVLVSVGLVEGEVAADGSAGPECLQRRVLPNRRLDPAERVLLLRSRRAETEPSVPHFELVEIGWRGHLVEDQFQVHLPVLRLVPAWLRPGRLDVDGQLAGECQARTPVVPAVVAPLDDESVCVAV